MELFDHIRKVSFIFFAITGIAHFVSGLLYINGYYAPESGLINRILFIPFVLSAITYGLSNVRYHLFEYGKEAKWITYVFAACGIVIFIGLLFIELLVMDSSTPLRLSA